MKKIKLSRGKFAIVDDEDFEFLSQWKWHCTTLGYAARGKHIKVSKNKYTNQMILMHREIIAADKNVITDHINGNTLDNRKKNLRSCTRAQNGCNRNKISKSKYRFKGISFDKRYNTWQAHITINGKKKHLGSFKTDSAAAVSYNEGAKKAFGEFARLNNI